MCKAVVLIIKPIVLWSCRRHGCLSSLIISGLCQHYTNNNVEFIVDLKILFHGWLIYSYFQTFKLIKCKWLPGECADWFLGIIMTWSYCLHRRYGMSQQKNRILINEHVLNGEPVPLNMQPPIHKTLFMQHSRSDD